MWLRRVKTVNVASSSPKFLFPSFKDIQTICQEDYKSPNPNKPSVFHRVFCPPSSDSPRLHRGLTVSPPQENANAASVGTSNLSEEKEKEKEKEKSSTTSTGSGEGLKLICLPGSEKRIVVYFTSLRIVRPTFEECHAVRTILRGFRVMVDERDVSMDSKFMEELKETVGENLTLPRVFIGGRYIGGAEEVKHLHEIGELKKFVEGLPTTEPGVCEMCGGYRFILCGECSGSRKCYTAKGGFRTCSVCNENGLVRCPSCL